MWLRHSDITDKSSEIIELSRKEIESISIGMKENSGNLRELCLTAYGYEVLTKLSRSLEIKLDNNHPNVVERIKDAVLGIGLSGDFL